MSSSHVTLVFLNKEILTLHSVDVKTHLSTDTISLVKMETFRHTEKVLHQESRLYA